MYDFQLSFIHLGCCGLRKFGKRVLGYIIFSRSQTTGNDHDVVLTQLPGKRSYDTVPLIPDRYHPGNFDSYFIKGQ